MGSVSPPMRPLQLLKPLLAAVRDLHLQVATYGST